MRATLSFFPFSQFLSTLPVCTCVSEYLLGCVCLGSLSFNVTLRVVIPPIQGSSSPDRNDYERWPILISFRPKCIEFQECWKSRVFLSPILHGHKVGRFLSQSHRCPNFCPKTCTRGVTVVVTGVVTFMGGWGIWYNGNWYNGICYNKFPGIWYNGIWYNRKGKRI